MKNRVTVAVILSLATVKVTAAEWVVDILADPTLGYDDNVFLQENERDSFEFSIKPTLKLSRNLENSRSSFGIGYSVERFFSESSLDSTNPFAEFDTSYDWERLQVGLQGSYVEDSTRNEALDDDGDFSSSDELRRRSISSSLSYRLTEIDSLTAQVQYSETDYSAVTSSDNETKSLTLGWQRRFSERFSGGLSATVSNYELDGQASSSDDDNYNLSVNVDYQLSEAWSLAGGLGYRRLESESTDSFGNRTDSTSTGSSYQIDSSYDAGLNTYTLGLEKQLSPSSSGDVNEQERISGTWSRQLSETLSSSLSVSYRETESASNNASSKRKNLDISPSLNWQLSSNMGMVFTYSYRKQEIDGITDTDVDSNSFSVNLNYDWDGIRFSR